MFGLFKSRKPLEPLDHERRKYFENNLLWLNQEFPEPPLHQRKIFTPTEQDFPIKWNHPEESARQALKIIAENMQLGCNEIELDFYDNGIKELNMGGSPIFLETDPETPEAAGLYHHKNDNGQYEISLSTEAIKRPDTLIATIAHELSHVKLLGQKGLEENDECLTDLATVFFGFGVFNANTAFQFYQASDRWGYSNLGYLKQEEWAYAIALLAFLRNEDEPAWSKYLNVTLKKDFERSLEYLVENEQFLFQ